jgi:Chaperone of endosialidase
MKTSIRLFGISFALLCLGLLPNAQAVIPPPDGGYPGFNTAEGQNALFGLTTGIANTAVGWFSLFSDTDGSFNTALGAGTLLFNMGNQSTGEGTQNTAIGTAALLSNTTGSNNTAVGTQALLNNTTGIEHTAYGSGALSSNTFGTQNTAIGFNALRSTTTGSTNVAIGRGALGLNTTGSSNIALGFNAGLNVTTASNVISIGNSIFAANVDNSCFIRNIFGTTTVNVGTPVLVDSAGQLGTISSSRRFKHEIKPMDEASEAILALKPVTFRYRSDQTGTAQFGLIAEDVAEVNPDLVVRDENSEIYSVRYDQVNAMLLNEFLKEHRRVEELKSAMAQQRRDFETEIVQQRKATEALVARLNEQQAQIQKVSAEIEMRKSGSQMLVENQ